MAVNIIITGSGSRAGYKIILNCPDNVSNMTYSHFFLKSGTDLRTSYNTVT